MLGTAGDTFLGGDDLDERLVDHMVQVFLEKQRVDLRDNELAMMRLRDTLPRMIILGVVPSGHRLLQPGTVGAARGALRGDRREGAGGDRGIRGIPGPLMPCPMPQAALEIAARGVVQGVGFRPFVHRLASRCGL